MMLNQCIFIGHINKIVMYNEKGVQLMLKIAQQGNQKDTFVSIEIPDVLVSKEYFEVNKLIAIKARLESDDGLNYSFLVERVTLLGGKESGS
ncbi:MAG: hypothetical protein KKH92_00410 [Firmicutes bacterium]|nr:hypothetical protein [Bacillota bacterium]